jgi:hypothetical protein
VSQDRDEDSSAVLGDAARLDVARRIDLVHGAIDMIREEAFALGNAERKLKELGQSKVMKSVIVIGFVAFAVGAWLWRPAYIVAILCAMAYAAHMTEAIKAERDKRNAWRNVLAGKVLWKTAGIDGVSFDTLIGMARSEEGLDYDSEKYKEWWYSMRRGAVRSVVAALR